MLRTARITFPSDEAFAPVPRLRAGASCASEALYETSISFCWQASRKPFLRLRKATPAVECGRNFEIPVSSFRGRSRLNVTVRTKCARQTSSIALRIGIKSFCLIVGVRRQCRESFRSVRHHTSMCWSRPLPQTEVSVTSFHKKIVTILHGSHTNRIRNLKT